MCSSDLFLNRLLLRVADQTISTEDLAIYFCSPSENGARVEPLRVDLFGNIENWPPDFFGDDMADIAARMDAAMRRQQDNKVAAKANASVSGHVAETKRVE